MDSSRLDAAMTRAIDRVVAWPLALVATVCGLAAVATLPVALVGQLVLWAGQERWVPLPLSRLIDFTPWWLGDSSPPGVVLTWLFELHIGVAAFTVFGPLAMLFAYWLFRWKEVFGGKP